MKRLKLAILGLVAVFSAGAVWADSIKVPDPTMIIVEGGDPEGKQSNFTFNSNGNGGGFFEFQNMSGVEWETLLITLEFPGGKGLNYAFKLSETNYDQWYATHHYTEDNSEIVELVDAYNSYQAHWDGDILSVLFYDANSIPAGGTFRIFLNDFSTDGEPNFLPTGNGGWEDSNGQPITFNAQANPEPGTWLLLLTGLIGLALAARFRR